MPYCTYPRHSVQRSIVHRSILAILSCNARYVARNLKNDMMFYTNVKTGISQFDVPPGF